MSEFKVGQRVVSIVESPTGEKQAFLRVVELIDEKARVVRTDGAAPNAYRLRERRAVNAEPGYRAEIVELAE